MIRLFNGKNVQFGLKAEGPTTVGSWIGPQQFYLLPTPMAEWRSPRAGGGAYFIVRFMWLQGVVHFILTWQISSADPAKTRIN